MWLVKVQMTNQTKTHTNKFATCDFCVRPRCAIATCWPPKVPFTILCVPYSVFRIPFTIFCVPYSVFRILLGSMAKPVVAQFFLDSDCQIGSKVQNPKFPQICFCLNQILIKKEMFLNCWSKNKIYFVKSTVCLNFINISFKSNFDKMFDKTTVGWNLVELFLIFCWFVCWIFVQPWRMWMVDWFCRDSGEKSSKLWRVIACPGHPFYKV